MDAELSKTSRTLYVKFPSFWNNAVSSAPITRISDSDCYKATISTINGLSISNPFAYTSEGPFSLWTETTYEVMKDVNWAFASLGFGPAVNPFRKADARFFIPEAKDDVEERELDTSGSISMVLEKSDLEFFVRLSEPFRKHDMIIIDFPYSNTVNADGTITKTPFFNLAGLAEDAVKTEFGGYGPYS